MLLFFALCCVSAAVDWTATSIQTVGHEPLWVDITVQTPPHWTDAAHRSPTGPRWLQVAFGLPYAWNVSIPTAPYDTPCSSLRNEIETSVPLRTRTRSQWDAHVPEETETSLTFRVDPALVSTVCRASMPPESPWLARKRNDSSFRSVGSRSLVHRDEYWFPFSVVLWGNDETGRPGVPIERHTWFVSLSIPVDHACFAGVVIPIDLERDVGRRELAFRRSWDSSKCDTVAHHVDPSTAHVTAMASDDGCQKRKAERTTFIHGRHALAWDVARCIVTWEDAGAMYAHTLDSRWAFTQKEDPSVLFVCPTLLDKTGVESTLYRHLTNSFGPQPKVLNIEVRCPLVSLTPASIRGRKLLTDDSSSGVDTPGRTHVYLPGTALDHGSMVPVLVQLTDEAECAWSDVEEDIVCVQPERERKHRRDRSWTGTHAGIVVVISVFLFFCVAIACLACCDDWPSSSPRSHQLKKN